ncbi:hypothetical protein [Stenotrophomonas maltophilia]|uniref:Uncharacterized protein n=1 Tax=Stenotrophomonas maltophilia TaxID=40324 RepID=A0AAJ2MTD3_STEMA|nr:hypothetical protein [Stenotrophomonas maltophilia]MDT3468913.1 hypothetical protein [Stenotrophomonas maltophilia]
MANVKYADPSYPLISPTDDDQVMFRTGAGADGRAPLVQPKGYIEGLRLEWVSGTQIRVTTGSAYVPGPKRIAELATAVTITPSLAASTMYHVYLTLVSGVIGAEATTTAPATPYIGTARAKTGDTSRRYLGSFMTKADATIANFIMSAGVVTYQESTDTAPFRALTNGVSTTQTSVSLGPSGVPVTATTAKMNVTNLATSGTMLMSNPAASTTNMQGIRPGSGFPMMFPVDSLQRVTYFYSAAPSGGGGYIDIIGYAVER